MEVKIISNNENKLLSRKEIRFSVDQDSSTISKSELTKEICKKLNLSPESTIVVRIDQRFGIKESSGIAHSYENQDVLKRYEPEHLVARISKKSAKKEGAEEQKAEPKEEAGKKE